MELTFKTRQTVHKSCISPLPMAASILKIDCNAFTVMADFTIKSINKGHLCKRKQSADHEQQVVFTHM